MSQSTTSSTGAPTERSAGRPFGVWVVIVLSGLMVYRAVAFAGMGMLGDTMPQFWIVAFTGDAFMAVTAPIIVILLWRTRGLAVWTIAIAWQVIGIKDYTAGLQFYSLDPSQGIALWFILGGGIVIHLLNIYLLSRFRRFYLG